MASSILSAPITSCRGAADTTAGPIYFSTPSAQVRVPVGDLVSPPPLMLTLYYLEEKLSSGGVKLSGGVKIIRWGNNYPGRARAGQKFEKKYENCRAVSKIDAQCRKNPIPYLYTLSRPIPYLNTLNRTIRYLYTLKRTIPFLNTLRKNPSLA